MSALEEQKGLDLISSQATFYLACEEIIKELHEVVTLRPYIEADMNLFWTNISHAFTSYSTRLTNPADDSEMEALHDKVKDSVAMHCAVHAKPSPDEDAAWLTNMGWVIITALPRLCDALTNREGGWTMEELEVAIRSADMLDYT